MKSARTAIIFLGVAAFLLAALGGSTLFFARRRRYSRMFYLTHHTRRYSLFHRAIKQPETRCLKHHRHMGRLSRPRKSSSRARCRDPRPISAVRYSAMHCHDVWRTLTLPFPGPSVRVNMRYVRGGDGKTHGRVIAGDHDVVLLAARNEHDIVLARVDRLHALYLPTELPLGNDPPLVFHGVIVPPAAAARRVIDEHPLHVIGENDTARPGGFPHELLYFLIYG